METKQNGEQVYHPSNLPCLCFHEEHNNHWLPFGIFFVTLDWLEMQYYFFLYIRNHAECVSKLPISHLTLIKSYLKLCANNIGNTRHDTVRFLTFFPRRQGQ